jgi:peptide chain release factor 1
MYIPPAGSFRCQDGRSQQKNKEKALEHPARSPSGRTSSGRKRRNILLTAKARLGRAAAEEKIRTYNFPQNRITDHRIGLTLYNLDRVIEATWTK